MTVALEGKFHSWVSSVPFLLPLPQPSVAAGHPVDGRRVRNTLQPVGKDHGQISLIVSSRWGPSQLLPRGGALGGFKLFKLEVLAWEQSHNHTYRLGPKKKEKIIFPCQTPKSRGYLRLYFQRSTFCLHLTPVL